MLTFLLFLLGCPLNAQELPIWTTEGAHFNREGQPRLLLVVGDLELTPSTLAAYREAGLDAVWVRSLLNDTPEGIRETFEIARSASMPLIGGMPIPNLKHFQVERIRQYAKEPAVAAWYLLSSDAEILKAALNADPDTFFLVPSDIREELPERTGTLQHSYRPVAVADKNPPAILYTDINKTSDATALGFMARLAGRADGLVFNLNYKGDSIGQTRLEWLKPRIPVLRALHRELLKRPWEWRTSVTAGSIVSLAETAAGSFAYCSSEKASTVTFEKDLDEYVVYQASDGVTWKKRDVTFSKNGEIWLGPKTWHDRMTKLSKSPSAQTAKDNLSEAEAGLVTIQSRMEQGFEFCASVLGRLTKAQLERHFPALLPKFKNYYGEQITPLTNLKSADGKSLDIGDLAIGAEAEGITKTKRENDSLGTQALTGKSDLQLLQRIRKYREKSDGASELEPLLQDLRTLEDDFQSACLRWESADGRDGDHLLQPIGESDLAGGVMLLNFSREPVEMLLADGAMKMELWTSALFTPDSKAASNPAIRKLTEKNSGVRPFGKTQAVNYSQGYTVVIPPGAQREFMVSKDTKGQFYYVPLNRNSKWASQPYSRGETKEEQQTLPGTGTKFFIEQKLPSPPVIWSGELWRPLDTLSSPPEKPKPLRELKTHLYRGEWETVGFSIHNPNDVPMALLASPELDVECTMMAFAYTRAQIWTLYHGKDVMLDLRYSPPDRPIPEGPVNGNLIYLNSMGEFWVPPHETRQVFLIFKTDANTPSGDHRGQLHLIDPFDSHKLEPIALEVKVWPISLPPKSSFKGTGFTIGSAIFRPQNAQDAYDHYFNHLVTTTVNPAVSIDWEKEEFTVGNVPEKAKEETDFKSCLRLAPEGFTFFLSGWGATGMDMKYGGIGGFIDQSIREQKAAAENEDAKSALTKLGTDLKDIKTAEKEDNEFEDEIEDEEKEKPKSPADLLREKADRIKKKYWPGTPGYEKLSQEVYKKAIDFYLEQGFKPEHLLSYVWDEAPRSHFPSVIRMAELMKEVHPNIRTYVTCLENLSDFKSNHAIDIYTPHMGHVYDVGAETDAVGHSIANEGRNASNLKRYQETGRELWIYMQHGGYIQGKHAVDYPMGLLWRAWQMDLKGVGIFSIRLCRGDLGYYPTKCYEAFREGVEDFLAMRALEAEIINARKGGVDNTLIEEAERTLRERSQEVLGMQWWWSDMARRYRLIRAARQAFAEAHVKLIERRN